MNKYIPLFALPLLPLLSLSSCFQLNVGETIRYPAHECIDVDTSKPVDNAAYQVSADEYVMQVPEMRFRSGYRTIYWNVRSHYLGGREWRSEPEPTGRMRWVKVEESKKVICLSPTLLEEPPNLKGAKKIDAAKLTITRSKPDYNPCSSGEEPSTMQYIAAAPFDYLIDPIGSVPLTIGTYSFVVLASPVILFNCFFASDQQQEEAADSPPPAQALAPVVMP